MTIRDRFLEVLRYGKHALTLFLTNGVKLEGLIHSADDSGVVLQREGAIQFVERAATSTFMPKDGHTVMRDFGESSGTLDRLAALLISQPSDHEEQRRLRWLKDKLGM